MQCKPIIIATTPRTGSNNLQLSLSNHPQSLNGGEWFNHNEEQNMADVWQRKIRQIYCNLFKVFAWDIDHESYERFMTEHAEKEAVILYLYRENREEQLASWKQACESGVWVPEQVPVTTYVFPEDAPYQIERAEAEFKPRCTMDISTEELIRDWDKAIEALLSAAGWDQVELPPAYPVKYIGV